MAAKYLDDAGLGYFWSKIKAYIASLGYVLKNATNKVSVKEFLFRDVDNDALRIGGGSAHAKGGNILLYGKDHATHSGRVDFQAYDGTNYSTLKFEPTETRPTFYWLNGNNSGSEQIAYLTDIPSIPSLSRTISGSGNAITNITVSGHAITATKGSTFLTSASTLDATKLSGTIPSSCYTDTTYTAGTGLSLSGTQFSLASHNQASNTITAMTGYSKPSSGSAIATSDSLNDAIGKLEYKVDAYDDSNYVHKTGDELVQGIKTFKNSYNDSTLYPNNELSSIIVRSASYVKGTIPSASKFVDLLFLDRDGTNIDWSGRLGEVGCSIGQDGSNSTRLICYKNEVVNGSDSQEQIGVSVGYDASGNKFAIAPSTSSVRTYGQDILTRDWIPSDGRIVHTTGNETINGLKTFTSSVHVSRDVPRFVLNDTDFTKNSSTQLPYGTIMCRDSNEVETALLNFHCYNNTARNPAWTFTLYDPLESAASTHRSINFRWQRTNSSTDTVQFMPSVTALFNLGASSLRWKQLYISESAVSTSDERLKDFIGPVPDQVLDAWAEVDFCQFKMRPAIEEKGADAARLHGGLIAQRARDAFAAHGLDAARYGFFCYDEWEADEAEGVPAGDQYSVRYAEALCMEAAYMRRENARLKKRVADLEDCIAALELRLG